MEIVEEAFGKLNKSDLKSPIDLNIGRMTVIDLNRLEWFNYEIPPKKLKITNTGKNVVLCGNWSQSSPYITSGPLRGTYVFSQIHFHWGPNEMIGSEHYVDGGRKFGMNLYEFLNFRGDFSQPMELHAVHFKKSYSSQEAAMEEHDGIVMLVYFFKLQSVPNSALNEIINNLPLIQSPNTSVKIPSDPIIKILRPFTNDYFVYKGYVPVAKYSHEVTWLISREPIAISLEQLVQFRTLKDPYYNKILNNCRSLESGNPQVFYVNPSGSNYASLLPVPPTAENSI